MVAAANYIVSLVSFSNPSLFLPECSLDKSYLEKSTYATKTPGGASWTTAAAYDSCANLFLKQLELFSFLLDLELGLDA